LALEQGGYVSKQFLRVSFGVSLLLLLAPLLFGCSTALAQAGPHCTLIGYGIGRGLATVTCTPSKKTIVIPPSTSSEVDINTNIVWIGQDEEIPDVPIALDEQTYQELLNNICLTSGCTIVETSATGIDVKGGPPDKNVVTGIFDMLFSIGTWVATRYFGAGF